ncbi:E4 34K [Bovine mastadenovirus A]|uniref:E4 34K n=1 Tax=Bovine mastadenovirus A TaxID=129953 RepID=UPI0000443F9B|nr:E4 34K [Bovine mastadenovirus A]
MSTPPINIEVGEKCKHRPIFNSDKTVVHLCLEEDVILTKEKTVIVFDVKIRNPDGYYGVGMLSSLFNPDLKVFSWAFSSHLSLCTSPGFTIELPWWGEEEGPIALRAGTPVLMYKYADCEYDDCGHDACEPRNKLRFERRWARMSESERKEWEGRRRIPRCLFRSHNPAPIRSGETAHLCAESDMLLTAGSSRVMKFNVSIDVPFGWYARCSLSDLCGLEGLEASECQIWDESATPSLELRLVPGVETLAIARGTPICKVRMTKYRCGCPKCYLLQKEPPENQPHHTVDTHPNF